ncbi:MAG: radical SAM protein [Nanoarchaeota archaeon]|nr:radical SAM protein [Nanoarchaeota archaeon]
MITILDCYTDEPSGLGVPPYLGTYPRYIAGYIGSVNYLTIDDLRFFKYYDLDEKKKEINRKTNIRIYNLSKNVKGIRDILDKTSKLIVVLGVHTPGKYLSAIPGTLKGVSDLIKDIECEKILTGPAVYGTSLEGGKFAERADLKIFDEVKADIVSDYKEIADCSINGAEIVKQIPYTIIAEIETSRGCKKRVPCSFCTEPLKNKLEFREIKDIVNEIKALNKQGVKHFRLGKQSDFFLWKEKEMEEMLKNIRKNCDIKTLHIDNIDPCFVTEEKVKLVTKYCSSGNVAALGVETFDEDVAKSNNLNSDPETSMKSIRIINKYGSEIGENGMPLFIPGINLLFGLKDESKKTHEANMSYLKKILDEGLLLRRINVRQVAIFSGTQLDRECGNKFIKKNKKHYWRWRDEIRQKIDNAMLKRLVPTDTVLKDVRMEIYDGNTTFGRQIGTYPLVIGVKERLELGRFYDVKVTGHMLRSITSVVKKD